MRYIEQQTFTVTLACLPDSKHVASILKATSGLVTATVDKAHEL